MKDSEIYFRAARLQFNTGAGFNNFSCLNVARIARGSEHAFNKVPQVRRYAAIFGGLPFDWRMGGKARDRKGRKEMREVNNLRVLALLFMREIALDEEAE